MFNSQELLNATETPSSLTHTSPPSINIDFIKEQLRQYIILKNNDSIKPYDYGYLNRINTTSSGETLKSLFKIIRDLYIDTYKNEDTKVLLIKKLFDNIINNLDCVIINGLDLKSNEINSLILGFLNKNFI